MERVRRPSRSDERLSPEEEARMEEEVKEYFDGTAPKRHTKPQRSDFQQQQYGNSNSNDDEKEQHNYYSNPELEKFQDLQAHHPIPTQKLVSGSKVMEEEYVETEYYEDLNSISKQHHTTGTGFIHDNNVSHDDNSNTNTNTNTNNSYFLTEEAEAEAEDIINVSRRSRRKSGSGNPATNEWIPSEPTSPFPSSHKPNRSDI